MKASAERILPRAALLGLAITVGSHTAAAIEALDGHQIIPAWHWAALLWADVLLTFVVIRRGEWFLTRTFRLPGVFVVTTCIIILTPLPAAVRRYRDAVPYETVLSIAAGIAVFALVTYLLTESPPSRRKVVISRSDSALPWAIVGISVVLLPLWLRAIGSVPLFELFGNTNVVAAATERDRALNSLSSTTLRAAVGGLRNLYLMFAAGYLVSCAATATIADWRQVNRSRAIAGAVLGLASVYALLTTERAILGELVVVTVVSWLVSRRRRLSIQHVAASAAIGVSFPILYAILVRSGGLVVALNGLKRRIFFLPTDVMLHYFIAFPRTHDYLHGHSISKWGRFTNSPTFDLSAFIYNKYYRFNPSLTGIANGSFLGVGWANWGTVGVIVWSGVAAVAVVGVEKIVQCFSRPTAAALRGVAVVQTALLTSSDLTRSILGFLPGFLDVPLVMWITHSINRRFVRISSPSRASKPERRYPTTSKELTQ